LLDPLESNGKAPSPSITMAVRRGDRRLFQFGAYKPATKFCTSATTIIVSEQWLEGDRGPIVTVATDESECY